MYFSTSLLSTLVLAGGALAQYGSGSDYSSSSSYGGGSSGSGSSGSGGSDSSSSNTKTASMAPSPAASNGTSGQVPLQVVMVSNKEGTLKFYPNSFDMAIGSMVQFQFYPKVSVDEHAPFNREGPALTVSAYRIIVSFDLPSISHASLSRTTTQALWICFQGSCQSNQRTP